MNWTEKSKQRVSAQLDSMQSSEAFANAGRVFPLLKYLVLAELEGRGDRLTQQSIAVDVLERDASFDPQFDSIARVEVGRLRAKLHEYYATVGAQESVRFELPKGGYRPLIHVAASAEAEPLPPQEVRYCKTPDNVMLAYALMGDGSPIIKTSTWLTHLEVEYRNETWRHYLLELSRGRQLVRYDSRNMGMSDRNVERFDFEALVSDLETVVDDLGLERFPVFGTSQGVSVAIAYAARHPERVSHLILLGGFLRGPRVAGVPEALDFAEAVESSLRYGWQKPDSHFRQVLCRSILPDGTEKEYKALDELQVASCDVEDVHRYVETVHHIDVAEEAKQVRAPTLICHATEEMIPFAEARRITAHMPNSRVVPLASRNHRLQEREPAWNVFVESLNRFLATG